MRKISIQLFTLLFFLTSAVMAQEETAMDGNAEVPMHLTLSGTRQILYRSAGGPH